MLIRGHHEADVTARERERPHHGIPASPARSSGASSQNPSGSGRGLSAPGSKNTGSPRHRIAQAGVTPELLPEQVLLPAQLLNDFGRHADLMLVVSERAADAYDLRGTPQEMPQETLFKLLPFPQRTPRRQPGNASDLDYAPRCI